MLFVHGPWFLAMSKVSRKTHKVCSYPASCLGEYCSNFHRPCLLPSSMSPFQRLQLTIFLCIWDSYSDSFWVPPLSFFTVKFSHDSWLSSAFPLHVMLCGSSNGPQQTASGALAPIEVLFYEATIHLRG